MFTENVTKSFGKLKIVKLFVFRSLRCYVHS